MIAAIKKFKYLIIFAIIVALGFVAYSLLSSPTTTDTAGLQKTTMTASVDGTGSSDMGQDFVNQLLTIQNINFNINFFRDPVFVGLVDNHIDIEPQPVGRPNPFAPIGQDNGQSSSGYQDINGNITTSVSALKANPFANQAGNTTSRNVKKVIKTQ